MSKDRKTQMIDKHLKMSHPKWSRKLRRPLSCAFFFMILVLPIQFSTFRSSGQAKDDFQIGLMFLRFARYDSAIYRLENKLKQQPEFFNALVPLGIAYLLQGHFDQAFQSFQQALAKDLSNLDAYVGVGHYYYAKAGLRDTGMYLDVENFTKNIKSFGDDSTCSLIEQGLKAYRNVIEIDPNYRSDIWHDPDCVCSKFNIVDIHNSLGFGYWALRKPDLARKEFEKSLSLDPNDGDSSVLLELLSK